MKYSKDVASTCSKCPDGKQPKSSHKDCEPCNKGYYCSGGKRDICKAGTYSAGDLSACSKCKAGTSSLEGAKSASYCKPCKDGTTSDEGGICSDTKCKADGVYCEGGKVNDCKEGYYCKDGVKKKCSKGTYAGKKKGVCSACEGNTYTDTDGASSCKSCPDGQNVNADHTGCDKKVEKCEGDDFLKVKGNISNHNYCITRKNMGDSANLTIPSGVTILNANETASSSQSATCWIGKSDNTGGQGCTKGGYGGCERTVCTCSAATTICQSFNYGGWKWRVLQMENEFRDNEHIMADSNAGSLNECPYSGNTACPDQPGCYTASYNPNGSCKPATMWINRTKTGSEYWNYMTTFHSSGRIGDPFSENGENGCRCARSVRCIAQIPKDG